MEWVHGGGVVLLAGTKALWNQVVFDGLGELPFLDRHDGDLDLCGCDVGFGDHAGADAECDESGGDESDVSGFPGHVDSDSAFDGSADCWGGALLQWDGVDAGESGADGAPREGCE